jgi:hypothetical protein
MISVDFGNDLEWWTRGIIFDRILEGMPLSTDRDRAVKLRLEEARSIGGLDMTFVSDDMRTDIIEALLLGVDTVIADGEPPAGLEADQYLAHLRTLRDTARSARA